MSAFEVAPAKLVAWGYCRRGVTVKVRSSSSSVAAEGRRPPGWFGDG